MANALLTTFGAGGNINPFLTIGRALKARGHAVTLLTHCDYKETAWQAAFEFVALDTPWELKSFVEDGPLLNSLPGFAVFFQKHILPRRFRNTTGSRSDAAPERPCWSRTT